MEATAEHGIKAGCGTCGANTDFDQWIYEPRLTESGREVLTVCPVCNVTVIVKKGCDENEVVKDLFYYMAIKP